MKSEKENMKKEQSVVAAEVVDEDEDVAEAAMMEAEGGGITVIVVVPVVDFLVRLLRVVVHRLVLHSMPAVLARLLQSVGCPRDEIRLLPAVPGPDLLPRMQADALVLGVPLPISLVAAPPAHCHLPLAAAVAPLPSTLAGLARLPLQGSGADAHPAMTGPHPEDTFLLERIEQGTAGAPLHDDADSRVLFHAHQLALVLPPDTLLAEAAQVPAQIVATGVIAIRALAPARHPIVRGPENATGLTRQEIDAI